MDNDIVKIIVGIIISVIAIYTSVKKKQMPKKPAWLNAPKSSSSASKDVDRPMKKKVRKNKSVDKKEESRSTLRPETNFFDNPKYSAINYQWDDGGAEADKKNVSKKAENAESINKKTFDFMPNNAEDWKKAIIVSELLKTKF